MLGIVFRLDPDLSLHRVKTSVRIPNGTSWTTSSDFIYLTDSPTKNIVKYPYDASTGAIDFAAGTTFFTLEGTPYAHGVPDGHCQDTEGHFWIACYGTGKVVRVNPEGKVVAEISLPTRCVTCPAFCGTKLYITSAAEEAPEEHPWSAEYGGAVFEVEVGVQGRPLNKFKLAK